MSLESGQIANGMKGLIQELNKMTQEDANTAIDKFCAQMESSIFEAIKSLTITIPPGFIKVQGSSTAQANLAPIKLNGVIS